MITKQEYLKLKAVEILNEKIERRITPVGELLAKQKVTAFGRQNGNIHWIL